MPTIAIVGIVAVLGYVLLKGGGLGSGGSQAAGPPSALTPGSLGGKMGADFISSPTGNATQGAQANSAVIGGVGAAGAAGVSAGVAAGALSALAIPIVGAAIAGITFGLGMIFKHHAEAIKKEKGDIMAGVNKFYTLVDATLAAYNAHQISRQTAIDCIVQAYAQFLAVIQPVTKPSLSTKPPAYWGSLGKATGSTSIRGVHLPAPLPPFKTALPANADIKSIAGANGPYYVAYLWVLPAVGQLLRYFAYWAPGNGYSYTVPAMPASTDFNGIGAHKFVILPGGLN